MERRGPDVQTVALALMRRIVAECATGRAVRLPGLDAAFDERQAAALIADLIADAVAEEREACAWIAEVLEPADSETPIAMLIRDRGSEANGSARGRAGNPGPRGRRPDGAASTPRPMRGGEGVASAMGMEEDLEGRATRLRALVDACLVGVLETTPDGGILSANAQACRILGRTEADLRRVGRAGVVDPADPRVAAAVAERARTGRFAGELRLVRGDGTVFPAEVASAHYRDAQGREFTSMTVRDLSGPAPRAAVLAAARRMAGAGDRTVILDALLREAVALFGARQGGVFALDEEAGVLVPVTTTLPPETTVPAVRAGEGAMGEALRRRAPVAVGADQAAPNRIGVAAATGVGSVLAAPLVHDGRLLGAISVGAAAPVAYTDEDAEDLGVLAGFAAAELVGAERARLAGALLAARTAAHELNSALQLVVVSAEVLAADGRVPTDLRAMTTDLADGAFAASRGLAALLRLTAIEEVEWGPGIGTTIRLPTDR